MGTSGIQINNRFHSVEDIQQTLFKPNLSEWEYGIYKFILNWFDKSDFILQETSGSTGTPKEIQLKKAAMVSSAQATLKHLNIHNNDTAWLCLPINYIAGKMMVVRAIIGELNLVFSEAEGTPTIPNQQVQLTAMIPLQLQKLIQSKVNLSTIQNIIIGGAAMSRILIQQCQCIQSKVYASYGMTETCSHIALQQINGENRQNDFQVLDGISISKSNEGCLQINAPRILESEIETTDVVEITSEKSFRWLGRKDYVINSGGIKVSPEILERKIGEILQIDCIVSFQDDDVLGQKIVLVFEKDTINESFENILNILRKYLPKHHVPKVVKVIDEFPRNKSMKIDRREIQRIINY